MDYGEQMAEDAARDVDGPNCLHCGHPYRNHIDKNGEFDKYGCDWERGDHWVEGYSRESGYVEALVSYPPCGCKQYEADWMPESEEL